MVEQYLQRIYEKQGFLHFHRLEIKNDLPESRDLLAEFISKQGKSVIAGPNGIGDCTAWQFSRGIQLCLRDTDVYPDITMEDLYGVARMLGGQEGILRDGCLGVWAACAILFEGVITRRYGSYNASDAKLWGTHGVPTSHKEGRIFPIKKVALVSSIHDAKLAILSGYPVVTCAKIGLSKLIQDGYTRVEGVDDHAYLIHGYSASSGSFNLMDCRGVKYRNNQDEKFLLLDTQIAALLSWKDSWALIPE